MSSTVSLYSSTRIVYFCSSVSFCVSWRRGIRKIKTFWVYIRAANLPDSLVLHIWARGTVTYRRKLHNRYSWLRTKYRGFYWAVEEKTVALYSCSWSARQKHWPLAWTPSPFHAFSYNRRPDSVKSIDEKPGHCWAFKTSRNTNLTVLSLFMWWIWRLVSVEWTVCFLSEMWTYTLVEVVTKLYSSGI
jgi:hypothetical protein